MKLQPYELRKFSFLDMMFVKDMEFGMNEILPLLELMTNNMKAIQEEQREMDKRLEEVEFQLQQVTKSNVL